MAAMTVAQKMVLRLPSQSPIFMHVRAPMAEPSTKSAMTVPIKVCKSADVLEQQWFYDIPSIVLLRCSCAPVLLWY